MAVQNVKISFSSDASGLKGAQTALTNLTAEEKDIADGLKKIAAESLKTSKAVKDNFGQLNNQISNFKDLLIGAFAVDKLLDFGKKVLSVTAEFQKFEAVLTNTLGSNSKAQIALAQIADFAAKTPFSVAQLTESFVKLANQGFTPTTNQLRQLGDLASSTGKDFDQLAEAVIDAQVGEFERLKEFGIQASKEGDKVKFTFKGVETQVLNTQDAIRGYITGLGDLEGVSGSMAAISETLGGQISNLGDSMDRLFLTIGGGTSGVMSGFITAMNDSVNAIIRLIQTGDQIKENNFLKELGEQGEETKARLNDLIALNVKLGQSAKEAQANAVNQLRADLEASILTRTERASDLNELRKNQLGEQAQATIKLLKEEENGIRLEQERLDQLLKINAEYSKPPAAIKLTADEQKKLNKLLAQQQELAKLKGLTKGIDEIFNSYARGGGALFKLIDEKEFNESAKAAQDTLTKLAEGISQVRLPGPDYRELLAREQAHQDAVNEIRQKGYDFGVDLINGAFEFAQSARQKDFDDLSDKKARELSLVGDNEQAKRFINEKFAREEAALKTKQAKQDKAQSILNILLNAAPGIVKYTAGLPITASLLGLLLGTTALQTALIAAQPLPKYYHGADLIKGNPGRDTNLAWVNTGERIVPDYINKELKGIKNKDLPELVKLGKLASAQNGGTSYKELIEETKELKKAIKSLPVNIHSFDEKGYTRAVRQGQKITQIINQSFPH